MHHTSVDEHKSNRRFHKEKIIGRIIWKNGTLVVIYFLLNITANNSILSTTINEVYYRLHGNIG